MAGLFAVLLVAQGHELTQQPADTAAPDLNSESELPPPTVPTRMHGMRAELTTLDHSRQALRFTIYECR
jgi:hypothetical protein